MSVNRPNSNHMFKVTLHRQAARRRRTGILGCQFNMPMAQQHVGVGRIKFQAWSIVSVFFDYVGGGHFFSCTGAPASKYACHCECCELLSVYASMSPRRCRCHLWASVLCLSGVDALHLICFAGCGWGRGLRGMRWQGRRSLGHAPACCRPSRSVRRPETQSLYFLCNILATTPRDTCTHAWYHFCFCTIL